MQTRIDESPISALDEHEESISIKDASDSYNIRKYFKISVLIILVIFLIFGVILASRCIWFIWQDQNAIFTVMSHIYEAFTGAIIAIFLDRVLRK
jgi:hypothetical protein